MDVDPQDDDSVAESLAVPVNPVKENARAKSTDCDRTNNNIELVSGDLGANSDQAINLKIESTIPPSKHDSPGKSKRKSGSKKHRAGRNRIRKYKPYYQLTWDEREKIDERNARRAQRIRDEMSAVGLTLAPYNTTQFLMNDHNIEEPDLEVVHNGHKHREHSVDSSEENYYSCSEDDDYCQKQFLEDYESVHEEYMNALTLYDLVEQWMDLEDKIEAREKQLKELREQKRSLGVDSLDNSVVEMAKVAVFKQEIEKLYEENSELRKRNEELQRLVSCDS